MTRNRKTLALNAKLAAGPPTTNTGTDPRVIQAVELVANAMISRAELFKRMTDSRRDVARECGYPDEVSPEMYQQLYEWEAYAARVVELFPEEAWKVSPTVYEDEDSENATEFEEAWDAIGDALSEEDNHYKEEEGNRIWSYLKRADILSRIGRYGVILIGLDDGLELNQPVEPRRDMKLEYLRVFPETLAVITGWESDPKSPRCGLPVKYSVTFNDPRQGFGGGVGLTTATREVHWTRVIHIPSDLKGTSSEWAGTPPMQQVYQPLLDIVKIRSSAGEGFWRAVITLISLETHPSLGGDVEVNRDQVRDMMEQVFGGFKRDMVLEGMTAKTLAPNVVDPNPHLKACVETICVRLGVPVPIFTGFELGDQASEENSNQWSDRVESYRHSRLTPVIIVPLINRLINLGVLPEPKEGFKVGWPENDAENPIEDSTVLANRTTAMASYVAGGINAFMSELDYLTREMGYDEEEAQAILDAAEERAAELEEENQALADEQGLEPVPPEGFVDPAKEQQDHEKQLEMIEAKKPPANAKKGAK